MLLPGNLEVCWVFRSWFAKGGVLAWRVDPNNTRAVCFFLLVDVAIDHSVQQLRLSTN